MMNIHLPLQDEEPANEADMTIKGVYKQIWAICKLKRLHMLIVLKLLT